MADITPLVVNSLTAIFILLAMVFLIRNREYEKSIFENSINTFLFGFFLVFIVKLGDIVASVGLLYPDTFVEYGIDNYLVYVDLISQTALLPLFGVCFLIAALLVREGLEE